LAEARNAIRDLAEENESICPVSPMERGGYRGELWKKLELGEK